MNQALLQIALDGLHDARIQRIPIQCNKLRGSAGDDLLGTVTGGCGFGQVVGGNDDGMALVTH